MNEQKQMIEKQHSVKFATGSSCYIMNADFIVENTN